MAFMLFLRALYLFSPISIIDGAWWGQVDSLGVFIFLLAVMAAIAKKPFLAGLIYMAAMMTKLQNMIYGPVFFILVWQLTDFRGLVKSLMGALTGFIGYNFEFFISGKMNLVFQQLTVNYDYFPFLSLNSYNLWWIVAKGNGMHVLDKFTLLGSTNAKTIGLYIFSSFYLLAVVVMVKDTFWGMVKNGVKSAIAPDTKTIIYRFFSAMMLVASAFFLFQTESHDRYALPCFGIFNILGNLLSVYGTNHRRQIRNIFNPYFQIIHNLVRRILSGIFL